MSVFVTAVGPEQSADASGSPDAKVVLIHGALDRHNAFRRVARRLGSRHVVLYDRRGYGKSVELGPPVDMAQQVADLMEVVGTGPCTVVGHSMGGLVALCAAAAFPERFLAVGAFEPPTPWKPWWPRPATDPELNADPSVVLQWFYRTVMGDHAWERLSDRVRDQLSAEAPALVADLLVGRDAPVFAAEDITVPVLLGHGGQSVPRHVRAAQELTAELPDAELMVIPDASHGAHRSHADAFAAFIEATIART